MYEFIIIIIILLMMIDFECLMAIDRCKRLNGLGQNSQVLSKASQKIFAVKAQNWSESAHRFLKQCADAGNVEACYTLGMVIANLLSLA